MTHSIATVLLGPFSQVIPLVGLSEKGPISDSELTLIKNGGILVQSGKILEIGDYASLKVKAQEMGAEIQELEGEHVCLPGFVDCHTHICFGGSREKDYAMRIAGKSYLEIARSGGGIWDSVTQTRKASLETLIEGLRGRVARHLAAGITTIEVKSGYGLRVADELKMLEAIAFVDKEQAADLIPTCLAAHTQPKDFPGNKEAYLTEIIEELLPKIKEISLSKRVDIFIEETAFETDISARYLQQAKALGFDLTVHADQFSPGGSQVAAELGALSADHLEASGNKEVEILSKSEVVPVVLPGASLGLGEPFGPARKLLDAGCSLAIASDWNPGSGPMGQLLTQAAILGAYEKLSTAETFAALTVRAAKALGLSDRGTLAKGMKADLVAFPSKDYRDILYHQGSLQANRVWKEGKRVN